MLTLLVRAVPQVWASPPATEGFAITLDAIAAHGEPGVALPPGPPHGGGTTSCGNTNDLPSRANRSSVGVVWLLQSELSAHKCFVFLALVRRPVAGSWQPPLAVDMRLGTRRGDTKAL